MMTHGAGGGPNRLYPIQSCAPMWLAGFAGDVRQVLALLSGDGGSEAILFDPGGSVGGVEQRDHGTDDWPRGLGFTPGTIRVRKFAAGSAVIRAMPSVYQDFLADPREIDRTPAEEARLRADIREWTDRGRFVLHWGDEIWMEGDGTVFAT